MPEYSYETNSGTVTFNGSTVVGMFNRGGYQTYNWAGEGVPHVDRLIFDYLVDSNDPWNNENPIPEDKYQEMLTIAQGIDENTVSASGRERRPVVYHRVSSQDDQIIQDAIDRNWEYTSMTWREQTSPGNVVNTTSEGRIIYGSSRYRLNAILADITEELFEETNGTGNAPNNTPSKVYIHAGNGELNKLGKTMTAVSATADQGTEFIYINDN